MIVVAFVLLALGWLLEYCGFTNTDPRDELTAAFNGGHSANKGMQGGYNSVSGVGTATPSKTTGTGFVPSPVPGIGGNNVGLKAQQTGKMSMLPLHTTIRPGIQVDSGIAPVVIRLCDQFGVRVSSGKRVSDGDHKCGGASDFVGTDRNLKALYSYALGAGYAYVEPWHDSTTIGVLGTTGKHVHISFFRCS